MPLPGHPIVYSIAYLLDAGPAGLVVVDAGYASGACWRALEQGLAAAGRSVADITGVVLTHNHPDHYGLADRLRGTTGCWVATHELDGLGARSTDRYAEQSENSLILAGTPIDVRQRCAAIIASYADQAPAPVADRLLVDGDLLRHGTLRLEVIWTPGHTPGSICLREPDRRLLLTGDHLLPAGLTQLGLVGDRAADPLGDTLSSLRRLEALDVAEGLPGHQHRIDDVPARSREVQRGFATRLDEACAVVAGAPGATGWQVCGGLVGPAWDRMGDVGRRFSAIEAMGLLHALVRAGRLHARPGPPERFWATPL